MADLTPSFNELLKPHKASTCSNLYYSIERINEFLKEAYLIVCTSLHAPPGNRLFYFLR